MNSLSTARKPLFYTEAAYLLGIFILAVGTAFTSLTPFGVSMVVAPAFIFHLKFGVSFGVAEYVLQFILLVLLCVVIRKIKLKFLFSFVTTIIYGIMLDSSVFVLSLIPGNGLILHIAYYAVGIILCAIGISLLFHSYIPQEAYELFVKEISDTFGLNLTKFKIIYDGASLVLSVIMTFAFFGFGNFEGIGIGTIVVTFVNGFFIGQSSKFFDRHFEFCDGTKLRAFFDRLDGGNNKRTMTSPLAKRPKM